MVRPPPIQARRRRNNLVFYLLLNVVVSAATTLAVLAIWDAARPQASVPDPLLTEIPLVTATALLPVPTATLPPLDTPLIEIISVIGIGDLEQENVVLQRKGTGSLRMVGWQLVGENENRYVFPEQPELVLLEGAEIQVYSKPGDNSATAVFWNRSETAWRSGETIRLLDADGNERARYAVP